MTSSRFKFGLGVTSSAVLIFGVLWLMRSPHESADSPSPVEHLPTASMYEPHTPSTQQMLSQAQKPQQPVRQMASAPEEETPAAEPSLRPAPGPVGGNLIHKRFKNAALISSYESVPDAQGNFEKLELLKSDFKYPVVLVREKWKKDPSSGESKLMGTYAMVGDHVMVKLQPDASMSAFNSLLSENNWSIMRKVDENSGVYLISFEPNQPGAIDQVLSTLRSHPDLVSIAGADAIAFTGF